MKRMGDSDTRHFSASAMAAASVAGPAAATEIKKGRLETTPMLGSQSQPKDEH
jgi:hypothetical protein